MSRRSEARAAAAALVTLVAGLSALGGAATHAAFSATTANAGSSITAAPDFQAPVAGGAVIGKSAGGMTGFIRQGGTFFVYANVTDGGNPPSGVASASANVGNVATVSSAALSTSGCPCTAEGMAYGYRSSSLTAKNPLAAGTATFTITATDGAGNASTSAPYTVTVDNTPPSASDVQTTNVSGGVAGRPEAGDTLILTYSEPIDPETVLAGWTGASTSVTVRLIDGVLGSDTVQVWNGANTAQLPLGTVALGRIDFILAGTATFPATMSRSGAAIAVTLGSPTSGLPGTALGAGTMTWTPSATVTDPAGNACSTAAATESGSSDTDF